MSFVQTTELIFFAHRKKYFRRGGGILIALYVNRNLRTTVFTEVRKWRRCYLVSPLKENKNQSILKNK